MTRLFILIKNLVWPITPLTLIIVISLILTTKALIIAFANDHTAAIYAAVMIPITIILLIFYIVDRLLIRKFPYFILVFMELLLSIIIFFLISFKNRTMDISFHTDQDYTLVIFDSNKNFNSNFKRRGVFGKELNVYNNNIIHVDSLLFLKTNLRINKPKKWKVFSEVEGKFGVNGHSVKYILSSRNKLDLNYYKNPDIYIDSLINHLKRE